MSEKILGTLKLIKETALKHVNILSFFQVIWKIVP